jgi:hypothetical protein
MIYSKGFKIFLWVCIVMCSMVIVFTIVAYVKGYIGTIPETYILTLPAGMLMGISIGALGIEDR